MSVYMCLMKYSDIYYCYIYLNRLGYIILFKMIKIVFRVKLIFVFFILVDYLLYLTFNGRLYPTKSIVITT